MNSRQQTILQMVIDQGQVSVTDLAKATGVSEVTIRQDSQHLEKLSYLRRAHGFAVSLDSDDVETRMMSNYTLKRELAEFAASLVQPGETIFIENGSSNALARPDSGRAEEKCHYHHGQQLHRAFAERRAL
ncbi:DeoR family transcriptional regulator [Escherichia coli]